MSNSPDNRVCKVCGGTFVKPYTCSKRAWDQGYKTCSRSCASKHRGTAHLEKYNFKKGVQNNPNGGFQTGDTVGDKNPKWKGDNASYAAKHMWVKYHFGKADHCEKCGDNSKRMYHWANLSGTYQRVITDWAQMCVPCHKKNDLAKLSVK